MEGAGLKGYVKDGRGRGTGETARVDIQLELGSVTEQVEVTATSRLLAPDTSVQGQIMENASLSKLQPPQGEAIRFLNYFPTVVYSGNGGGYPIRGLRTPGIGYIPAGMNTETPATDALKATHTALPPQMPAPGRQPPT